MLIENPIYFDIETNGFLEDTTTIHCLGYADGDAPVELLVGRQQIAPRVSSWESQKATVVAHNGIAFDVPALAKVLSLDASQVVVIDTLVLSRFIFPDMKPDDTKLVARGKLPASLMGSHSLEAWGYRLGCHKGDYKGGWEEYNEEMGVYCRQDVEVLRKLYKHLLAHAPALEAVELEHQVQTIIQRQVRHGVCFNVDRAIELNAELSDKMAAALRSLKETYGFFYVGKKDKDTGDTKVLTPAKDSARIGYVAGAPFCPVELVEFNPGSRVHLAKVLLAAGWKPEKFTPSGAPKLSEDILSELDAEQYPAAAKLIQYLLIKKRLGQLSDGDNGWLKLVKRGRIHGSVNTNGAVTGRMTHAAPNLAQVPSVKKAGGDHPLVIQGVIKKGDVLYGEAGGWGYEMRDLFCVPAGKKLVGCDASGLELRMLAHYMGRYDNGRYGQEVVSGDIHTANQEAAGLPTRDNAKTFILIPRDDLGATPRLKLRELLGHPTGQAGGNQQRCLEGANLPYSACVRA